MVLEIPPGRGRMNGMSDQTVALVTGANKGIGYEIAAGLGALGWSVGGGGGPPGRAGRPPSRGA